ncbi:MAG TPA: hypothetical protein DDY68_05685 [Porphyromonadaceae bacterium]|nr:hypothetical protein [Porphyromonadaceae bacterium]
MYFEKNFRTLQEFYKVLEISVSKMTNEGKKKLMGMLCNRCIIKMGLPADCSLLCGIFKAKS